MEDINNKLDGLLENSLRDSLLKKPHNDFAKNLMLKISLEEEYAREDVKTAKFAKKIILSITGAFAAIVAFILYAVYSNPSVNENSVEMTERTSSFFEVFSFKVLNIFGLNSSGSMVLILSVIVVATLFLTVDKLILKKK